MTNINTKHIQLHSYCSSSIQILGRSQSLYFYWSAYKDVRHIHFTLIHDLCIIIISDRYLEPLQVSYILWRQWQTASATPRCSTSSGQKKHQYPLSKNKSQKDYAKIELTDSWLYHYVYWRISFVCYTYYKIQGERCPICCTISFFFFTLLLKIAKAWCGEHHWWKKRSTGYKMWCFIWSNYIAIHANNQNYFNKKQSIKILGICLCFYQYKYYINRLHFWCTVNWKVNLSSQ